MNSLLCLALLLSFRPTQGASIVVEKPKVLSPVVLIPGFGGSRIESRVHKTSVPHFFCCKNDDWYSLWLNLELLLPLVIDCWIDNVKLTYDNETRRTSNTEGVETRIAGWGDPEAVEMLDPAHKLDKFGNYFKALGDALEEVGYERNRNLRGAPYDFRKGPNENTEFFDDLRDLIEETFEANENTPVTLICHSMGCPMSLLFLQMQTGLWKATHISKYVTLSAPWGGLVKSVKIFAVGDDIGVLLLSGRKLRKAQMTMPSMAWLLPSPHLWNSSETLVKTLTRDYSVLDMEDFFTDLEYPTGYEMLKDTRDLLPLGPPGVEAHCLYGTGLATVEGLTYNGEDLKSKPKIEYGDGDGTVNLRSLEWCKSWQQDQEVHVQDFPGADHYFDMLRGKEVIDFVLNIVL